MFTLVQHELHDAISGVLRRHEQSIVTKWIVLCEVISASSERALWMVADREQKAWDTLGLLYHAIQTQQAGAINEPGPE